MCFKSTKLVYAHNDIDRYGVGKTPSQQIESKVKHDKI